MLMLLEIYATIHVANFCPHPHCSFATEWNLEFTWHQPGLTSEVPSLALCIASHRDIGKTYKRQMSDLAREIATSAL